jgi:hypothetical protein
MVPMTVPGGKPVIALPGHTPRSPVTTVKPVFVTVEPPRTAKLVAVPRVGAEAETIVVPATIIPATSATTASDARHCFLRTAMTNLHVFFRLFAGAHRGPCRALLGYRGLRDSDVVRFVAPIRSRSRRS